MRKLFIIPSLLFVSTILAISSCKKEEITDPNSGPGITTPSPGIGSGTLTSGISINTSVSGEVVDQNDSPISGANVTLNGMSTTTDQNGLFIFSNVSVDQNRAYITVEQAGYFLGSRSFIPSSESIASVKIELLPKTIVGSIDNGTGGTVEVSTNGPSLIFESGDVSLENGTAYSGTVNVSAAYLDPSDPNLSSYMPGDLQAVNTNGNAVVLETFGMVAVELSGSSGESLNVTPGESVELHMPVSSAQMINAPTTIPLWYFDEANGNWVEEGEASLVGSEYVGNLSHFSFWNCDRPYDGKPFTCQVVDENLVPIASAYLQMTGPNGTFFGGAYTDGNGSISAMMPSGIDVNFEIQDACGATIYSQNLGNGTEPIDLGQIIINNLNNTGGITGLVVDCNGTPIPNAIVSVSADGNTITTTTDQQGNINTSIMYCNASSIDLTVYDVNNELQSAVVSTPSSSSMDVGTVSACEELQEYLSFNLDGTDYSFVDLGGNEVSAGGTAAGFPINSPDTVSINATDSNSSTNIWFFIPSTTPGTYQNCVVASLPPFLIPPLQITTISQGIAASENSITIEITSSEGIGGYIQGTFSGTFDDDSGVSHTITGGTFKTLLE